MLEGSSLSIAVAVLLMLGMAAQFPTQQRVMMFMPIIFLVFCYNFAAALALYYTTQNLFTILQLWQNQRQPAPDIGKPPPAAPKRSKKGARS